MRELMLFRHAKSDWSVEGLPDFERALASRGRTATPLMARHLQSLSLLPDQILCSTSRRTRQTLELLIDTWQETSPDLKVETIFEDNIYEAAPMAIVACLANMRDDASRVMVIGHNPGLEDLALYLLKDEESELKSELSDKFPTATLAHIEIETRTWASIPGTKASLKHFVRPRDLE